MCTSQDSSLKFGLKLYVSTIGNDSWSGKLQQPNQDKTDGPCATLWAARDAIRELKETKKLPKGNVVVEIQGGVYELPKVFELEAIDGGTDSLSRIIYSGQKGAEVRLSGGKNLTKWELVTDKDVSEKLSRGVRNNIYQTDLRAAGISDFGSPGGGGMELFFNDKPMWLSRYPNKGFVKITGLFNVEPVDIRGTKGDQVGKFNYDDPRISLWKNEKDAWVHGYWFWDWSAERHKIAKLDTARRIIELVPPYHHYGYRLGQWFYGFNLLSEIDEPGEYYVDRENGLLYFYPPSGLENGHTHVSLNKNIISMNQVSFLTIQGVILEGCRETIVTLKDCNQVLVAGCTLRNSGDWGVTINGGSRNGVTGCDIYGLGAGGIRIEAGDRKTLVPGGCFADNNDIHHTARIKRIYNPCISLYGVGNRASHNVMAHVPHMAIYFDGNDHLMEYNDISDVCYESNDAGAIYAGRNWTMRGTIIRYNYLHDISGFEGKGCVGIYLDDSFSSADIIGNVFNNVTRAMMIGGGRDNSVINNIFIDCVPSLHVDARGMGWMQDMTDAWIREAGENGTILGAAYKQPPYSTRYPKLPGILSDEPKAPKGNVISCNISVGGNWDKASGFWGMSIEDKARPYLTMEDNIVAPNSGVQDSLSKSLIRTDPLFVNPKNPEQGKFQLAANSPALKRGFKQIPFDRIGLYKSEYRAGWPIDKQE
ncbi:MAG: right-handed parallel beta-helix repeat-containing protein [Bacteroidia bacterium]|nr:right-handed parallel beta-helix repeat-containing protein [Bacteroidia bacterium]